MSTYYPVKAGMSGTKIHAGVITREYDVVIAGQPRHYQEFAHICGAGNSSHFHNHHKAHARFIPGATLADINCSLCLRIMKESD